ncbi:MAG: hypothetical protein AB8G86_14700 [Saprospiraceae bacterium]
MSTETKNWYTHPTKTILIIITLIWLLGIGLLLVALTDYFQKRIDFDGEFMLLTGIIGGSTAFVYETFIKFLKNKKEETTQK